MGYSKEAVHEAKKKFDTRKSEWERKYEGRKAALYTVLPEVKEIDEELAKTGSKAAGIFLARKGDFESEIKKLKAENEKLIAKKTELISSNKLFCNMEKERYYCDKCKDSGYIDNKRCECYEKLIKAQMCERLNSASALKLSGFENFSLEYYSDELQNGVSPKRVMAGIFEQCKKYAKEFSLNSGNILMQGNTGLGKTHLSLSIAKEVIEKGYGAVYCSAHNIFDTIEKERFSASSGSERDETLRALLECDLLVIDDLGAEFTTQFVAAAVNNIINTRMLTGLPTIISTNLSLKEIEKNYGARILSRIIGEYKIMSFMGSDIRWKKAKN